MAALPLHLCPESFNVKDSACDSVKWLQQCAGDAWMREETAITAE